MGNQDTNLGVLGSSVDATKMAATIEGFLIALAGLLAFAGVDLSAPQWVAVLPGGVQGLAQQIAAAITLGATFYGTIRMLFGVLRKFALALAAFFEARFKTPQA